MHRTRALLPLAATAACLAAAASGAAPTAPALPDRAVDAIVFIDVIPSDKQAGTKILTDYARRAQEDPSVGSVVLIEQADIPNHFVLEESFPSGSAYARFARKDYVRAFRAALFPHLGSPWDERLGVAVPIEPAAPSGSERLP